MLKITTTEKQVDDAVDRDIEVTKQKKWIAIALFLVYAVIFYIVDSGTTTRWEFTSWTGHLLTIQVVVYSMLIIGIMWLGIIMFGVIPALYELYNNLPILKIQSKIDLMKQLYQSQEIDVDIKKEN